MLYMFLNHPCHLLNLWSRWFAIFLATALSTCNVHVSDRWQTDLTRWQTDFTSFSIPLMRAHAVTTRVGGLFKVYLSIAAVSLSKVTAPSFALIGMTSYFPPFVAYCVVHVSHSPLFFLADVAVHTQWLTHWPTSYQQSTTVPPSLLLLSSEHK